MPRGTGPEVHEAAVIIGGQPLTFAQSMALRVAVGDFLYDLNEGHAEALGPIGPLYRARLEEVRDLIMRSIEAHGLPEGRS